VIWTFTNQQAAWCDVMPSSSHSKRCLEIHLHKVGFVSLDFMFRKFAYCHMMDILLRVNGKGCQIMWEGREVTITFSSLLGTSLRVAVKFRGHSIA